MTKKQSEPHEMELVRFREWALKSGYPFENDVEEVIISVDGDNRSFIRPVTFKTTNEDGDIVIRSIDFMCTFGFDTKSIPSPDYGRGREERAYIKFLIDAKYAYAEIFWFVPAPKSDNNAKSHFPYLIPKLTEDRWRDNLNIYRGEFVEVSSFPKDWAWALGGRKVKEQTKERDSLSDYQGQMTAALYDVVDKDSKRLGSTTVTNHHYSRDISIYIPIIVTNAPLYLLNEGVTVGKVNSSQSYTELCRIVDVLFVMQPDLFHVRNSFETLSQNISSIATNSLEWVPWDVTAFPIIFTNPKQLKVIMEFFVKKIKSIEPTP